jgi:hypothetical protein
VVAQLLGEARIEVPIPLDNVPDRFWAVGQIKRGALEQRFHTGHTLIHLQVEGLLTEPLRDNQFVNIDLVWTALLQVTQIEEEQCEAGQALLAIHDVIDGVLLADDDRAQEVVGIVCNLPPFVVGLILLQEFGTQVVDQLVELFVLPFVLALVVVNRVFHTLEQLADGLCLAQDLPHY